MRPPIPPPQFNAKNSRRVAGDAWEFIKKRAGAREAENGVRDYSPLSVVFQEYLRPVEPATCAAAATPLDSRAVSEPEQSRGRLIIQLAVPLRHGDVLPAWPTSDQEAVPCSGGRLWRGGCRLALFAKPCASTLTAALRCRLRWLLCGALASDDTFVPGPPPTGWLDMESVCAPSAQPGASIEATVAGNPKL